MTLPFVLLAAYGMCFGLVNEKLPCLNWVLYRVPVLRDVDQGTNLFSRLFECSFCTGFHTGWMTWFLFAFGAGRLSPNHLGEVVLFAFASAAFCFGLDTILQWFEKNT